jgi:hypothetical protein
MKHPWTSFRREARRRRRPIVRMVKTANGNYMMIITRSESEQKQIIRNRIDPSFLCGELGEPWKKNPAVMP